MASVTHVKSAQQRYATKPVIDPATGQQKITPVISKRTGEQKRSKRGVPQVLRVTERDTSKPLPMPKCGYAACKVAVERDGDKTIRVGDAYKHLTTKTTYGSTTYTRHEQCPTWHRWEYSSSLDARVEQIAYETGEAIEDADNEEGVTEALSNGAEEARGLAEEKRESATNIEEGFGQETEQSTTLNEQADALDAWADEMESADVPSLDGFPCEECEGSGEHECETCTGEGEVEAEAGEGLVECEDCKGTGEVDCDNCDEDHFDHEAWREALDLDSLIGEPSL